MHLTNTLYVCATLIAAVVAQTPTTTSLHFTTIPTALVAGEKQTIGWAGGNGNGVNIILQQGTASNLQDVPIAPIATGEEGTSTTWTPPKSLPDAGNYALRIEQGEDSVNYSGMLQLFGGCSTCPTDAVAALASSTGSPSSTASSSSKSGTPAVAPASKSSSNSTGAAGSSGNSTTTGSGTNSTMGTGSMANMTMPGTNSTTNSTLTSATLHATSSKSSSVPKSTSSSTSSSSSESTSSSTGSTTSPSPTKKSGGVTVAASNFALVLCAIVGVVYLG